MFTEDNTWNVFRSYFETNNLVSNQIESYDDFVTFGIQEIIDQEPEIVYPNYSVKFGQITLNLPQVLEEDRTLSLMYPNDARLRDINYDSTITCDIYESYTEGEEKIQKEYKRIVIGKLPIMLESVLCNLSKLSEDDKIKKGECPNDKGGYFIIKGNERVLVAQMRNAYNQIFVLKKKTGDKFKYIAETRSMSNETGHSILLQAKISMDKRKIYFSLPHIKEPIFAGIVFKALGYGKDSDIASLIGLTDQKSLKFIRHIVRDSFFCQTKEQALEYIGQFAMHTITKDKEADYAKQVVETELLPHLGISGSIKEKACFLGYMIKKLILTTIKYREEDDRDNYSNKRIEIAGTLMYDIFRNLYKKFLQAIKAQLEKRKQKPDILSIIGRIKNITKGLHQCLATGNWGVQKNASYIRTGVSQVLDRMTYCATLSHLRRIIIPIGKEGKNTAIRQIHTSSFGFICPCETPEGSKIGVVLNFALTSRATKKISSINVKRALETSKTIIFINDFKVDRIHSHVPVFLNGAIIGYTQFYEETLKEIRHMRNENLLDRDTSVTYDSLDDEIRIFCDEGRFSRPLLTLDENKLNIQSKDKYKWKKLIKNGLVRYLDASEIENSVISMYPDTLHLQKNDYCEMHPIVMLGIMASQIPFPDHSQSPRNCYQCLWMEETVLMANGEYKKIADIKIGEDIITVNPNSCEQTITKVINQYVRETDKKIVKVTTLSGREVICTHDHPILTNNGWVKAGETQGKLIAVFPDQKNFTIKMTIQESEFFRIGNNYTDLETWCGKTIVKNNCIFVPVTKIVEMENVKIADITTASETHSFITGQGICVHNSSMGKQALGISALSYNLRADTLLHVLQYVQKPLVRTKIADILKMHEMPSGIIAIVAIASYTGYNQEDSLMVNKTSTQRGLFVLTSYHTIDCNERKRDTYSLEEVCLPPENSDPSVKEGHPKYFKRKNANYGLLDSNGIIKVRGKYGSMKVKKGDVIIGKVVVTGNKSGEESKTDASIIIQAGEEGTIDRVYTTITPNGYKLVKVVLRVTKEPTIGDKLASREAQKGTIGMLYSQQDMPFTCSGIVPDIIMSLLAVPSRMTLNQLIECALGKECCISGNLENADATPFTKRSKNVADKLVKEMSENLAKYGFTSHGKETMYNGMTGEMMEAKIFIGPTYYQRLKHMVDDKMHARAKGHVTMLTRQPLEGQPLIEIVIILIT